jgi:hypothetical protein
VTLELTYEEASDARRVSAVPMAAARFRCCHRPFLQACSRLSKADDRQPVLNDPPPVCVADDGPGGTGQRGYALARIGGVRRRR